MRMMMKLTIPAAKGSQAIQDGSMARVLQTSLGQLKPEAAYFFPSGGKRGGLVVFDLADPSQIPAISEPLFQSLDAELEITPVMTVEDLQKGLAAMAQGQAG